jgi:hypothetical protein
MWKPYMVIRSESASEPSGTFEQRALMFHVESPAKRVYVAPGAIGGRRRGVVAKSCAGRAGVVKSRQKSSCHLRSRSDDQFGNEPTVVIPELTDRPAWMEGVNAI